MLIFALGFLAGVVALAVFVIIFLNCILRMPKEGWIGYGLGMRYAFHYDELNDFADLMLSRREFDEEIDREERGED